MKKIILSAVSLAAAAFLLIFSAQTREAVSRAISDCLEIIVPSLFAFSALAIYLQKSGLYKNVLKPLAFPMSKILRTDEELCGIILLSNIGGYPVGASLLSALVAENRLDKRDAARLMCCCFGSGPSFVIGMVGKSVFNSTQAGAALFAACFLSSLAMAFIVRSGGEISLKKADFRYDFSAGCFINSVSAAARAMFSVCTMIVIFSVIAAIPETFGVSELFNRVFSASDGNSLAVFHAILEITRIKEMTAGGFAMPVCAALLTFGGICVFLQTTALVGGKIPLGKFLLSRIPAMVFSAAFATVFTLIMPEIAEQTLAGNISHTAFSGNAALSLCLLAMCGILLADNAAHGSAGGS